MVEKTIMVPTYETVTRTIQVTECRPETRERTYTVMRRVPKTETVTRNYTVMVPQQQTRTVNYTVCKPVYTNETVQYTVQVPYTEAREATRRICRRVPTTLTRTITVDEGHWETQAPVACDTGGDDCAGYASNCGDCGNGCGNGYGHGHGRRHRSGYRGYGSYGGGCGSCGGCDTGCNSQVWVPNPVQKEINYTVYKTQYEDQPYTYNVCLTRAETRERTVQRCSLVNEAKTREVSFTRMVPEERTKSFEVTRYECVPEERTQAYTVNVPYQVDKEIQVQVCKMVPKTIMVPACNSYASNGCGGGGCGHRGGCGY
jgi:hypothetical protein